MMVDVPARFTRSTQKRSPGESMMPGFPFGPIRPNTRAGLPLTERVLVPVVRRSLAAGISGAAVARRICRKGSVRAIATPDARMICRRVRSVGLSFSLIAACPFRSRSETSHQFNLMLVGVVAFCVLLLDVSDGGAEMTGERYRLVL